MSTLKDVWPYQFALKAVLSGFFLFSGTKLKANEFCPHCHRAQNKTAASVQHVNVSWQNLQLLLKDEFNRFLTTVKSTSTSRYTITINSPLSVLGCSTWGRYAPDQIVFLLQQLLLAKTEYTSSYSQAGLEARLDMIVAALREGLDKLVPREVSPPTISLSEAELMTEVALLECQLQNSKSKCVDLELKLKKCQEEQKNQESMRELYNRISRWIARGVVAIPALIGIIFCIYYLASNIKDWFWRRRLRVPNQFSVHPGESHWPWE